MKIKVIFHILAVLALLFFLSCGGGGGGSDTPSGNSDNNPPTTEDDSTDDSAGSNLLPTPEVIPIPLNEGAKPILPGNIFSQHGNSLYLVDDSKPLQTESDILFDIRDHCGFQASLDGQLLAFVPSGEFNSVIRDLEGNQLYAARLYATTDDVAPTWLINNNLLYVNDLYPAEDLTQIRLIDIPTQNESIIFQYDNLNIDIANPLAISPDKTKIAWITFARRFHDDVEIYWANFDGINFTSAPQKIWSGSETLGNNHPEAQDYNLSFISNERFVFFLLVQHVNENSNYSKCIFLSDTNTNSTDRITYTENNDEDFIVSNSGQYIAFPRGNSIMIMNTNTWESAELDELDSLIHLGHNKQAIVWSPDDKYLLAADGQSDSNTRLFLYSLADLSSKWLLTELPPGIDELEWR